MTASEAHQKPFKDIWKVVTTAKTPARALERLKSTAWVTEKSAQQFLESGGMPGMCFLRDRAQRTAVMTQYLDTLLSRDIQFISPLKTRPPILKALLRECAIMAGEPLNLSALARKTRLSVPSVKNILGAFEALFLLSLHGRTLFFNDPGLGAFLQSRSNVAGTNAVLGWVFHELRAQVAYHPEHNLKLSAYQTPGGAHVPFVLEGPKGRCIGVTIDEGDFTSEKSIKSLYSFQRRHKGAILVNIHHGKEFRLHRDQILCIPWTALV